MGIFGGFKAKFTRNSRSKDHIETIICTKYKINSEFEDDGPVSFKHNHRIRNLKKNPSKKDEKIINHKHSKSLNDLRNSDQNISKTEFTSPRPIQKAESTQNASVSPHSHELSNIKLKEKITEHKNTKEYGATIDNENPPPLPNTPPPPLNMMAQYVSQNEYDETYDNITNNAKRPKDFGNASSADFQECITVNSLYLDNKLGPERLFSYTTTEEYEEVTPKEEYKVTFPMGENDLEPSTLILMTQPSLDGSNVPESPGTPIQFTELHETEGDFKVNVVKYDSQRNYSLSEDELSTNELDNEEMDSILSTDYRSHAASIYFGKDMEQSKPQPTKIILATNEDKVSTKDADNEEINNFSSYGYTSQAASIFFGINTEQPKQQPKKMILQATSDEEDC